MIDIVETFNQATEMRGRGCLEKADELCRQILRVDPCHLNTLYLAGIVALQVGRPKQAYGFIIRALAARPCSPDLQNILGLALTALGKSRLAMEAFRKALDLDPHFGDAHYNLGNVLKNMGKMESAIEHYESAVRLKPHWAEAHYNMAHAHAEVGKIDSAINSYQEAIKLNPEFIEAYINLGVIFQKRGALNQALACHQTALELDSTCFDAFNNLGLTLRSLGKTNQAIVCFERALKINPGCVDALIHSGQIYQERGEMKKAEKAFNKALSIQPDSLEAYYHLTGLNANFDRPNAIAKLERLEEKNNLSIDHRILLQYTLGNMYTGTGNDKEAFDHYRCANELEKQLADGQFQLKDIERQVALLVKAFDAEFFSERKHFGISSQLPVFIVGMPRSGTTLVEQIISSHPLVFGAGELSELKRIEEDLLNGDRGERFARLLHSSDKKISAELAEQYLSRLRSYSKEALRVTDKYPHNFMRLWLITLLFPGAKIIHCRRDPVDTCLSCYFTKFSSGHAYKNDLRNLGLYYRLYQRLMDHWHRVLPLKILDVDYENLVENQHEVSRRIIEFCDLPWDDGCLEFHKNDRPVQTASLSQVRRKIYTTSSGRWKRYEKYLGELLDALNCNEYLNTADNSIAGGSCFF